MDVKLSIIIPLFNEEGNLEPLYTRLTQVMQNLDKSYEIIFIDDGSTDNSFQILNRLHQKDECVKAIRFTRNFGQHVAIRAGLNYSKGDYVVLMDADLQDQPEEIVKLLDKIYEGYDIVYGIRRKRKDNFFKSITSSGFRWLLSILTHQNINPDLGTFQIMTRRVIDYINKLRERSRFHNGLVAWLGFPYSFVTVEHDKRFAGKTKYNLWKLIQHATEGIVSFSDVPLHLAGYFGLTVSLISFIIGVYMIIRWFLSGVPIPGYTSIIVSLFFIGGVILIVLEMIGLYIGRIHIDVKQRPLYIVRDILDKSGI
jgi:glycosyltransferase involved in cell wall biosynthesis